MRTVALDKPNEKQLLDHLKEDSVLHIFTISDLKWKRDKTKIWIASENGGIVGYVLEFDGRIVHTHGRVECIEVLLERVDLNECTIVMEPPHLDAIKKYFEPTGPTDLSSKGQITTYLVLKVSIETFQPRIKHPVKRLIREDLDEVSQVMGEEYRRQVGKAVSRGIAFGAYDNGSLVSVATVPEIEILDDLALIRGLYTAPSHRGRGLGTSACSALVAELMALEKEAMLWVAEDNVPARKVCGKIGFRDTGQILLGFKARRL